MEQTYWIGRQRAAVRMARQAATAEARLFHYELAGRHAIKAAHCPPARTDGSGVPLHRT